MNDAWVLANDIRALIVLLLLVAAVIGVAISLAHITKTLAAWLHKKAVLLMFKIKISRIKKEMRRRRL